MTGGLTMRLAMARVMWLSLLRDRGALAMAFLLPAVVFAIFAVIFSGASSGDLNIRVAVADERQDAQTERLLRVLATSPELTLVPVEPPSAERTRIEVLDGAADVGLVIAAGDVPLDDPDAEPAIELLVDPSRDIAVSFTQGLLGRAFQVALPEAMIRRVMLEVDDRILRLTDAQRDRLEQGIDVLRFTQSIDEEAGANPVFRRVDVVEMDRRSPSIAYYAAAVAIMFGLFSSLTAAVTLIEERASGLLGRLAVSVGGIASVVDGKLVFIFAQCMVQTTIIFVVAWFGFGVALPADPLAWLAVTAIMSLACAGLTLGFVSLCRTSAQAQNLGNFVVLILSAVGGSMVPRFLMPAAVQDLGWFTPHTWVLESYATVLWRGGTLGDIVMPMAALGAVGIIGAGVARRFAHRLG